MLQKTKNTPLGNVTLHIKTKKTPVDADTLAET